MRSLSLSCKFRKFCIALRFTSKDWEAERGSSSFRKISDNRPWCTHINTYVNTVEAIFFLNTFMQLLHLHHVGLYPHFDWLCTMLDVIEHNLDLQWLCEFTRCVFRWEGVWEDPTSGYQSNHAERLIDLNPPTGQLDTLIILSYLVQCQIKLD